jgi:hypothetical protein
MSLLLAATLAAAIQPTCSWDHPGSNPYTGSPAAAIDRYTDIPESVRGTLKRRLEDHLPDDAVSITRDHISGKNQYDATIRDMHFGAASVCGTVTRTQWSERHAEPAAVYCVGEHCILVPKVCGNVSRISKVAPAAPAQAARQAHASDKPPQFADVRLDDADAPDSATTLLDQLAKLDRENDLDGLSKRLASAMAGQGLEDFVLEGKDPDDDEQAKELARRLAALGVYGTDGLPAPVPEADTWAMLVSGLGLVGWMARRRARAAANAAANVANATA